MFFFFQTFFKLLLLLLEFTPSCSQKEKKEREKPQETYSCWGFSVPVGLFLVIVIQRSAMKNLRKQQRNEFEWKKKKVKTERERERRTAYLNTGVEDTFLAKPTVTVDSTFRVLEGAQR